MAEYIENQIRFGWLNYEEMVEAIENGDLDQFDICFTRDTHEQYLIDSKLNPVSIKSRLRIYASVEAAIEDINSTNQTYSGEIISIRDGEKFIAYVVNQFADETYYISPICSDGQVDYNDLQNVPLVNIEGTVANPINLLDLDDGFYKVTGHFISPSTGKDITSIVGNIIIVESSVGSKTIKRIGTDKIFDYVIASDGSIKTEKYATDEYIKSQGFATEEYVENQMVALKASLEEYVREYVATTCTLLIKHMIEDELNMRYSTDQDIKDLFN